MEIRRLTWEEVQPIWNLRLWFGRDSEPVTSMMYLGGYDMAYKEQTPVFLGVKPAENVIAVNSYVRTEGTQYRSRGLWVDPDFRGKGLAKKLLTHMLQCIRDEGGTMVWTMPREEALSAYESAGFVRTTDWFDQEWGRNCYAMTSLRTIEQIEDDATTILAGRKTFYVNELMMYVEGGSISTEDARQLMKPLADEEQGRWG